MFWSEPQPGPLVSQPVPAGSRDLRARIRGSLPVPGWSERTYTSSEPTHCKFQEEKAPWLILYLLPMGILATVQAEAQPLLKSLCAPSSRRGCASWEHPEHSAFTHTHSFTLQESWCFSGLSPHLQCQALGTPGGGAHLTHMSASYFFP